MEAQLGLAARHRLTLNWIALTAAAALGVEVASAYTLTGNSWPGAKPRIPFHVSLTFQDTSLYTGTFQEALNALQLAAQEWGSVGDSEARFVYRGTTTVEEVADDGINALIIKDGVCPHGGACSAAIYYHLDGTTTVGFDVVFYTERGDGHATNYTVFLPLPFQTHLTSVARHELGHALGLGHSTSAQAVMTPGGYGWISAIEADDISGVKAVYGAYTHEGLAIDESNPAQGTWVALQVDFGPKDAGQDYEIVVGSSGASPGWDLHHSFCATQSDSRFVPVNAPWLSTADPNGFIGFSGELDGQGRAIAQMWIPVDSTETRFMSVLVKSGQGGSPCSGMNPPNGVHDTGGLVEVTPSANPSTYCTAKTASNGCLPSIGWSGQPLASLAGGFHVTAVDLINSKNGLLLLGLSGPAAIPFQGGSLCVQPPLKRGPIANSGGSLPPSSDCSGSFDLDFDAFAAMPSTPAGFSAPGATVNVQWWGRDPGYAAPNDTLLTDAVEFTVEP